MEIILIFLGDRYQLQDPIGRGGLATIYRGWDLHMERVVAVKVLRDVYSTDPKFVTRFQREAKVMTLLHHPNIVQGYDYGQTDGNYYIVMELIEGTDLQQYLHSRGILDTNRAIIIAHDVAIGLGAAHIRSIVHRDLKLKDILIGRAGEVKLIDFGPGMTLNGRLYSSPECLQGEIVTPASDVYSIGIIMYQMVTGQTPFDGDTPVEIAMRHITEVPEPPSQLNPNIPTALDEIILRCLEKSPDMRYKDGSELARALEMLM